MILCLGSLAEIISKDLSGCSVEASRHPRPSLVASEGCIEGRVCKMIWLVRKHKLIVQPAATAVMQLELHTMTAISSC